MDVLTDQTRRGQLIRLSEEEAKVRFPRLVIASLGANRKDRTVKLLHQWPVSEHQDATAGSGTFAHFFETSSGRCGRKLREASALPRSQRMLRRRTARSRWTRGTGTSMAASRSWSRRVGHHRRNFRRHVCVILLVQSLPSSWEINPVSGVGSSSRDGIMFVAGALELERPFLGPLYKFVVLHLRESMRRVPSFVSFILHFLADQVAATRHYNCAEILEALKRHQESMHKQVMPARGSEVGSPVVAKVVPSIRSCRRGFRCRRGFPLRSHTKSGRGSSPYPTRPP